MYYFLFDINNTLGMG